MPTKYIKINQKKHKQEIIARYVAYMERIVIPKLESILKGLYLQTFSGWTGGGDSQVQEPHDQPDVKITSKVSVSPRGIIKIEIHSVAVDNVGQPHLLYFWLDFGTKAYQHQTRSAAFPVRQRQRWKSGSGLNRGPGISNSERYGPGVEWRHIPAGAVRKGITGSNITAYIARDFHSEINRRVYPVVWRNVRRIDLGG